MSSARLAVDIGGTFTDVVLEIGDKAHAIKVLTTPDAPERGVMEGVRTILAQAVFHLPETQFRVVARDVGGGFGMKGGAYPEEGLVLLASRRLGRPVKWIATRSESLLTDNHGRDQVVRGEMALDASGHILAIRAQDGKWAQATMRAHILAAKHVIFAAPEA